MRAPSCSQRLAGGGNKSVLFPLVEDYVSLITACHPGPLKTIAPGSRAVDRISSRAVLSLDLFVIGLGTPDQKQEKKKSQETSESKRATGPSYHGVSAPFPAPLCVEPHWMTSPLPYRDGKPIPTRLPRKVHLHRRADERTLTQIYR